MERPGNVVADVALDWLGKNHRNKFFLWMHLYDPHYPYRPPAPYSEPYKDRPYDWEIAFADAQVGRLIAYLRATDSIATLSSCSQAIMEKVSASTARRLMASLST